MEHGDIEMESIQEQFIPVVHIPISDIEPVRQVYKDIDSQISPQIPLPG